MLLAVGLLSGCDQLQGRPCTLIGGWSGISATIDVTLWVPEGDVTFTVCADGDCVSATDHLPVRPQWVTRGRPEERSASIGPDALGHRLDDGTVQVLVEMRDATGRLVARRRSDVDLTRYWPNGKACDEEGYVNGSLELRPEDAVAAGA